MKTQLLIAALFATACSPAFAQGPTEIALYEKLVGGANSTKALDTVLAKPDSFTPVMLFTSAGVAFKEKRLEDSAFLFYAAQLRTRFDKECFTPRESGANDPFLACAALAEELGSAINPAVMAAPKTFAKVMSRLKAWSPQAPAEYDPGYEYTARKTEAEATAAVSSSRAEFLAHMGDLSTLLNDAEYFAAFRTLQAFNLGEANGPTEAANEAAMETMMRIEKARKLHGVFSE